MKQRWTQILLALRSCSANHARGEKNERECWTEGFYDNPRMGLCASIQYGDTTLDNSMCYNIPTVHLLVNNGFVPEMHEYQDQYWIHSHKKLRKISVL
jgi:hypothetical protein